MSQAKRNCISLLILLALIAGIFGLSLPNAGAEDEPASVILAETPFGTMDGPNGAEWGDSSLETRNVAPLASSGKSLEYMNKTVGWWALSRTLSSGINARETLGVSYDAEAMTSDMGVAFWLYLQDEATMYAVQNATVLMWIGPDSGNTWHESVTGIEGLTVGWNEIVIKHNAAWFAAGAPASVDSIAHLRITIENLGDVVKNMGLNNVRLVRTSLASGLTVNRTESIGVDESTAVPFMDATEEGLARYWPEGAQLSDHVPEGMSGQSVKLPARATGNEKVFTSAFDATAAGADWLDPAEIGAWQSAAALSFWMYIPDVAAYQDAMANSASNQYAAVQFSSTGSAEGSVYISLKDQYASLQEGWNRVTLRLFSGALDVSNINYFSIYNHMEVDQAIEIYGVCLAKSNLMAQGGVLNDNTTGAAFPNSSHTLTVSEAASAENWTEGVTIETASVDSLGQVAVAPEGESFALTSQSVALTDWAYEFLTVDIWFYTNNPTAVKNAITKIELAESAAALEEGNCFSFDTMSLRFVRGWNLIRLKLTEDFMLGTVDAGRINYFAFTFPASADCRIAVGAPRFFESTVQANISIADKIMELDDADPDPEHKVELSGTDTIDEWDQYGFGIMPYGPEEGQYSLYLRSESGVVQTRMRAPAVDISGFNFNHTVLTFWFWVSDAELMSDLNAQIELGSGLMEDDNNEIGWDFKLSSLDGLESGKWNKIVLRILPKGVPGSNEVGMVDLSSIRYFRMYWIDESKAGPTLQALLSTLTIEEMDVSAFGDEKLMITETREFTQGTTPGAIDEYDMIESADGTFPQERPGTNPPDSSEPTVPVEEPNSCNCAGSLSGTALWIATATVGASIGLLWKRRRS